MAAEEFIKGKGGKDCSEAAGGWGLKSTRYDYIWKGDIDEDDYPKDACDPRYHGNAQNNQVPSANWFRCGTSNHQSYCS